MEMMTHLVGVGFTFIAYITLLVLEISGWHFIVCSFKHRCQSYIISSPGCLTF